ncbi:MAG: lamin tail domain-containing protein [Candidatus Pacebacteria bacterium]|nr:lamin tail domain-containing protein [Candidatus Paceibacterota bacterium]
MLKDRKINKYKGRLPAAIALFFLFCAPLFLFAQIEITEIMYDPGEDALGSKADGGREWIEIYNSDLEKVENLTGWKLVDKDGGHPFSVIQGSFALEPKEYLIVADIKDGDESTFLTDWPNFSGTILNSKFGSLINKESGETLIIKDSDSKNVIQASYFPFAENKDIGNSFQKISDGSWGACAPTPGEATTCNLPIDGIVVIEKFLEEIDPPSLPETPQTENDNPTPPVPEYIEPRISARIIPPTDTPIAGADFLFEAQAFGIQNRPLQNAKYQWTFGDGSKAAGQKVLHNYQYPSDYMAVLEVISGECSSATRLKIKVIPSDIIISELGTNFDNNFIELHNPSAYELNLSWWRLRADNNYWTIPKNTILLPKSRIKFSARISNLFPRENSQIQLLYPNGRLAFEYAETKKISPDIPKKTANFVVKTAFTQNPPQFDANAVQKQPIVAENSNQMAAIAGAALTPNLTLAGPTSSNPIAKQTAKKSPFNKWAFSLLGITIIAIAGMVFVVKLDKNDPNI